MRANGTGDFDIFPASEALYMRSNELRLSLWRERAYTQKKKGSTWQKINFTPYRWLLLIFCTAAAAASLLNLLNLLFLSKERTGNELLTPQSVLSREKGAKQHTKKCRIESSWEMLCDFCELWENCEWITCSRRFQGSSTERLIEPSRSRSFFVCWVETIYFSFYDEEFKFNTSCRFFFLLNFSTAERNLSPKNL